MCVVCAAVRLFARAVLCRIFKRRSAQATRHYHALAICTQVFSKCSRRHRWGSVAVAVELHAAGPPTWRGHAAGSTHPDRAGGSTFRVMRQRVRPRLALRRLTGGRRSATPCPRPAERGARRPAPAPGAAAGRQRGHHGACKVLLHDIMQRCAAILLLRHRRRLLRPRRRGPAGGGRCSCWEARTFARWRACQALANPNRWAARGTARLRWCAWC